MNPRINLSKESLARALAIIGIAAVIVLLVIVLAQSILFLKEPAGIFRDWLARSYVTLTAALFKKSDGSSPTATSTTSTNTTPTPSASNNGNSSGEGITAGPRTDKVVNMGEQVNYTGGVGIEPHAGSGKADLVIRFKELGYLDRTTNAFTPVTGSVDRSQRIGVKFDVVNVGGSSTGRQWNFNAYLPVSPAFIYNADMQQILNPGEKIEYTLGFDRLLDQRSNTLRILLDGGNLVDEANENNNEVQIPIPTL